MPKPKSRSEIAIEAIFGNNASVVDDPEQSSTTNPIWPSEAELAEAGGRKRNGELCTTRLQVTICSFLYARKVHFERVPARNVHFQEGRKVHTLDIVGCLIKDGFVLKTRDMGLRRFRSEKPYLIEGS